MAKVKCMYGECKYFKKGKCTKEREIAKLSNEELAIAIMTNKCSLREEK